MQLHLEDCFGLNFCELVLSGQSHARFGGRFRCADELNDFIDMIERLLETFQNVCARFGLSQFILCAAADHLYTMLDEVPQQFHQRQDFRLSVHDSEVDHAEARLHRGQFVELVENNQPLFATF